MIEYKNNLKELVKSEKELNFLNEILEENEVPEKEAKSLKYYARTKLKSILDIAKTGDEYKENEILSLIINLWFEWRSEWIRYNAINNYNMVFFGNADLSSVIKASYISHLIAKIEQFIPSETLQKINDIMVKIQFQN